MLRLAWKIIKISLVILLVLVVAAVGLAAFWAHRQTAAAGHLGSAPAVAEGDDLRGCRPGSARSRLEDDARREARPDDGFGHHADDAVDTPPRRLRAQSTPAATTASAFRRCRSPTGRAAWSAVVRPPFRSRSREPPPGTSTSSAAWVTSSARRPALRARTTGAASVSTSCATRRWGAPRRPTGKTPG